jgi:uncharacterized membrane protein
MRAEDFRLDIRARYTGFSGLQCASLSFFLLEACLIRLDARPAAHAASIVIAALLAAMVYRGIAAYRSVATSFMLGSVRCENTLFSLSHLVSALLLVGIGYMGVIALRSGWATLAALYVACIFLFPWVKLALCRKNLPAAWLTTSLGVALGFLTADPLPQPALLAFAVWSLWITTMGAWLRLLVLRRQKSRASRGAAGL